MTERKTTILTGLWILAVLPGVCWSQNAPPANAVKSKIGDLAWLAGTWESQAGKRTTEEHWMVPRGGLMLGTNRTVRKGGRSSFEFLRIAETSKGIVYYASPGGRAATPFPLKQIGKQKVVFSNPKHDFPQTIAYERTGDTLRAKIAGTIQGQPRSMQWEWKLVKPQNVPR